MRGQIRLQNRDEQQEEPAAKANAKELLACSESSTRTHRNAATSVGSGALMRSRCLPGSLSSPGHPTLDPCAGKHVKGRNRVAREPLCIVKPVCARQLTRASGGTRINLERYCMAWQTWTGPKKEVKRMYRRHFAQQQEGFCSAMKTASLVSCACTVASLGTRSRHATLVTRILDGY